ncbi:MAG: HesB/IscA family protein [Candidatus Anammoxibacter sp.]
MINFTNNAIKEINRLFSKIQDPKIAIRLSMEGESYCGDLVKLTFDSSIGNFDKTLNIDGIKVVINRKAYVKLQNVTIDHSNDFLATGFKFSIPDKNKNCDCHL